MILRRRSQGTKLFGLPRCPRCPSCFLRCFLRPERPVSLRDLPPLLLQGHLRASSCGGAAGSGGAVKPINLMSLSSPGQAYSAWSASLYNSDLQIDIFLRSGLKSVPVALVPTNGESIHMKNPKIIREEPRKISDYYQMITEVRQFGRGGILCCSPDQACITNLLKCTTFASNPVSCFVPVRLACVKGLVQGVDLSLSPPYILELFAAAGAVSVFRCSRNVENKKVPTKSVIVTFAGTV